MLNDFDSLIKLTTRFNQDPAIVSTLLKHPTVAQWITDFIEPQHIINLNITKDKTVKVTLPQFYTNAFLKRTSQLQKANYEWEMWCKLPCGMLHLSDSSRLRRSLLPRRGHGRRRASHNSPRPPMTTTTVESPQPHTSVWLRDPSHLIAVGNLIKEGTVAIHSTDEKLGYPYKFIQPHMGIEQVLNRPSIELIGQPVTSIDSVIAEARIHAIRRAIDTGAPQFAHYKYYWDAPWSYMRKEWKKMIVAIPLVGVDEVLVKTVAPDSDFVEDQRLWEKFLFKEE